ncbi:DNA-binding protein [Idiomarina aminovorans]|uniref:DNA-binding protein n=1 Tax=Idiomarina aminovorans TaxID=2914829 RepID=UPI002003B7D9|nr:DNA-binding protein [Idiomarina sp. ATCH4]MCK7460227.1 DNA-binding protein [Idiomarina sp. ATCH4]
MARHPEVSEQQIIDAGLALEKRGKRPNAGAIRVQLGDRGGLARIKSIWDSYENQRDEPLYPTTRSDLSFDVLPSAYADEAELLIEKVSQAMKHMAIAAYGDAQSLFERRLKSIEANHAASIAHYQESEQSAVDCVEKFEDELDEIQAERDALAEQNAKLMIENAELRGRLDASKE